MSNWIDVSVPLHNAMPHWPGDKPFQRTQDDDMNQGAEYNLSSYSASAHAGTHMDAPLHFVAGARSIDEMPLEASVGPARVIEIRDPHQVTSAELKQHNLRKGERVLLKTCTSSRRWFDEPFTGDFVYISPEAAQYIGERKVGLIGVDYLSVGPYEKGDESARTHQALLRAGVWIIEGLYLGDIEPGDYELVCLPVKIQGSEGAPARAMLRRLGAR